VGKEVTEVKAGDFVSAEVHLSRGHCHQCWIGEAHICQKVSVLGIDQDGAFAEFVQIPASDISKLDRSISEHYGAILDGSWENCVHRVSERIRASLLGIPTEWVPLDLVNEVIFKGMTVQGIYGRRYV
jgi:threonine 3-dehydrogenase